MKLQHKVTAGVLTLLFIIMATWSGLECLEARAEDISKMVTDLLDEQGSRLDKVERKSMMDRLNFTGDYRFEAHNIVGRVDPYYDGMKLQNGVVGAMFYMQTNAGAFPANWEAINNNIKANYADYLYFTNNLTFADLKTAMAGFPAAQQQALMSMLQPATLTKGHGCDNNMLYTHRLRLNFNSELTSKLKFMGRLSMYKAWGDSTGVQVFNGQPNSMNIDGTTTSVPNSDILRVDRAFFTWKIEHSPFYISIGRRPSTGGPPLNLRKGTLRGGTPMGTLVDFQFDGITVGSHLEDYLPMLPGNAFRLCYGVGYDSGFGNTTNNGLDDTTLYGFNWDIYNDDDMFIQATYARAEHVTDGFNGLVVLPVNPVTGVKDNSNHVMRYTPSQDLGNLDLGGLLFSRHDGFVHYFASWAYMSSDPKDNTTPFGGLFCDPFEKPRSQAANMVYAGARVDLNILKKKTMFGLEYNHGSKYWFNFSQASDDILSPKLATRGSVWELYSIFEINRWANLRLAWQNYDYEYSGSGWHMGAPKDLDSTPTLGFPTYRTANVISFSTNIRF